MSNARSKSDNLRSEVAYSTGVKNTSAAAETASPAGSSLKASNAPVLRHSRLPSNYRPDIDGLRALAIIPVVLFHAFPSMLPGGFVGVDIFFVISGFLISSIILQALQRESFSFAGFYANRIRRLFPALLAMLAACFVFGWFFLLPDEYAHLGKHIVGAATYIENFLLHREAGYFDISSHLKPLMHLWSLGIEEQFYLTYPLFLWLVWRHRRHLFTILLAIAVISFCLNLWQVRRDVGSAFFLPQTRAWELMAGGAIACWTLLRQETVSLPGIHWLAHCSEQEWQLRTATVRNISSATGLGLIVFAVLRIHENDPFPGWWALFPVCGASLLICGGPDAWINRKLLSHKCMVLVGLISYPLYLWHWPMLSFPRILRGSELSIPFRGAAVLLSFGLAWATFRFIESPIRFGHKSWIKPVALTAMSLVIASLGYAAYRDGFIDRFPNFAGDIGHLRDVRWSTPECRNMIGLAEINYCRSSSTGAADVLLIGDSHSAVLYDGMAPAYQQRSQVLTNLGQSGCAPLYDTNSFSPGISHPDCRPVVNRMLDFAATSATAHTIILSLHGSRYMSGQGFGPIDAAAAPKEILWEGAAKNIAQPQMFAASLRNTVARLSATGKNVILFMDWPELGFDPRSCLPRPISFFSSPRSSCSVPRVQVEARSAPYREVVRQLQMEFKSLKVFDPLPYLCDSSACYAMKDGHLFYSDDNHVSATGAAYLSGKFLEEQSSKTQPVQ